MGGECGEKMPLFKSINTKYTKDTKFKGLWTRSFHNFSQRTPLAPPAHPAQRSCGAGGRWALSAVRESLKDSVSGVLFETPSRSSIRELSNVGAALVIPKSHFSTLASPDQRTLIVGASMAFIASVGYRYRLTASKSDNPAWYRGVDSGCFHELNARSDKIL